MVYAIKNRLFKYWRKILYLKVSKLLKQPKVGLFFYNIRKNIVEKANDLNKSDLC